MFGFFKKYTRKKALGDARNTASACFPNLKEIHSIGFIYNIRNEGFGAELEKIGNFLRERGIPFSGILIESKKRILNKLIVGDPVKKESEGITVAEKLKGERYEILFRKEINWAGIPRLQRHRPFMEREYDLFISFNDTGDFTSDYIAGRVNAKFVTGMRNFSGHPYTLVMEGENRTLLSYDDYLKQIFHYLDIINRNATGE